MNTIIKHKVVVRSSFDRLGHLKIFEVIKVSPPLSEHLYTGGWEAKRLCVNSGFELFIEPEGDGAPILWLLPYYDRPRSYTVKSCITKKDFQKALKVWNNAYKDIEVVDISNNILGEI